MTCYVNDLSLCGQYSDAATFLEDLAELMRMRSKESTLEQRLFCSRTLHTRPVTQNMNFRQAVESMRKHILVPLVLTWLTKNGPFWDDVRVPNDDDYFESNGQDVTNYGLGEAARRLLVGFQASSFSFASGGFDYSPIDIVHGLPESPLDTVSVPNFWDTYALYIDALAVVPAPVNWKQMLELAQSRYDKLIFSANSIDKLLREPFSQRVVEQIFIRLEVLQRFMACRHENGHYTEKNHELIAQHFTGEKAWFTDESETNKKEFKEDLSFPDTEHSGHRVFCSWHGKIKSPQYRIHFEWPVDARPKLRIFYIGPKITKS